MSNLHIERMEAQMPDPPETWHTPENIEETRAAVTPGTHIRWETMSRQTREGRVVETHERHGCTVVTPTSRGIVMWWRITEFLQEGSF